MTDSVDREYGVGLGRLDLPIRKPYGNRQMQREAIELKVWAPDKPDPLTLGLRQLDRYLDGLHLDSGTLIIFDRRRQAAPVGQPTAITEVASPDGHVITLVRA